MARDVAQRELDQGDFRITNLGKPKEAGDATITDNESKPRPNSGSGSPGKSLLAAPADHVHPASGGEGGGSSSVLEFSDASEQMVTGKEEQLVAEYGLPFPELETPKMFGSFSALGKVKGESEEPAAELRVKLGGKPGKPDGKLLMGTSITASEVFEPLDLVRSANIDTPSEVKLVKITIQNDDDDTVTHIKSKSLRFTGIGEEDEDEEDEDEEDEDEDENGDEEDEDEDEEDEDEEYEDKKDEDR